MHRLNIRAGCYNTDFRRNIKRWSHSERALPRASRRHFGGREETFFRLSKILVNFSGLLNHVLTQRDVTRNNRSEMSERSADRENESNRCRNNRAVGDTRAEFFSFFFSLLSSIFAPLQPSCRANGWTYSVHL